MNKTIKSVTLDVTKFKKEFARLSKMTTYQRAMDRAADIKADKWLSYTPLTKAQLFDTVDENVHITVVSLTVNGRYSQRSTHRGATWHQQQTVIARPTEMRAILHAQGLLVLDSDFVVIRQEPNREIRYCILCKRTHEVADFVHNKRYLNGLSYACKRSLDDGKRGFWRKAA